MASVHHFLDIYKHHLSFKCGLTAAHFWLLNSGWIPGRQVSNSSWNQAPNSFHFPSWKAEFLKVFCQAWSCCFALSSLILVFFPSAVGAVRRKVVATEMRLPLTLWSLTGRRWIFIFLQKFPKILLFHFASPEVVSLWLSVGVCHLWTWTNPCLFFKWCF